jgi:hypothetical protein
MSQELGAGCGFLEGVEGPKSKKTKVKTKVKNPTLFRRKREGRVGHPRVYVPVPERGAL